MCSHFSSYLDALENIGVNKIKAYSTLLEGGENGSEMKLLMKYFKTVQLIDSPKPETVVFSDFVNICDVSFIMRAMGYYPSETEVNQTKLFSIAKRGNI